MNCSSGGAGVGTPPQHYPGGLLTLETVVLEFRLDHRHMAGGIVLHVEGRIVDIGVQDSDGGRHSVGCWWD